MDPNFARCRRDDFSVDSLVTTRDDIDADAAPRERVSEPSHGARRAAVTFAKTADRQNDAEFRGKLHHLPSILASLVEVSASITPPAAVAMLAPTMPKYRIAGKIRTRYEMICNSRA